MQRDQFLTTIRRRIQTSHLPDKLAVLPARPPLPTFKPTELIDQFTQEATTLSAQVYAPASPTEAFDTLLTIFEQYEATDYLAWDSRWLPLDNLNERLTKQGFTRRDSNLPPTAAARQRLFAELREVPVGLTGTVAALADTGTIVVHSGPGRSRLASLLPPVHVALLKTDLLLPSMDHFFQTYPEAVTGGSNLVFISGPSRTADIEGILTLGVHGPKELHIVLI